MLDEHLRSTHYSSRIAPRLYGRAGLSHRKSLFDLICGPIPELQSIQVIFVEATCWSPVPECPALITHFAVDDCFRMQIKIPEPSLPRLKKSPLIPLRHVVMNMGLRLHPGTPPGKLSHG